MKLKELYNSRNNEKGAVSKVSANRFRLTLDKENIKIPHFVMQKVEDLISDRSSLANGLRQLTLFVMPDLKFHSSDEKSSLFANEWLNQRDMMEREIFNFVSLFLGGGNAYFQPTYLKTKNGKKELDSLSCMPTPSSIYYNLYAKDDSEYWIVEYPTEVFKVGDYVLKFYPISYVYGSYTWRKNVWGRAMHKDELIHLKFLWSKNPFYGNGLLSSAVDNEDIAEEILKNWALAAKYRSLSKKIIGFYNQDGESIDMSELDTIKDMFDGLEEEDSLLVNKRFESSDLTFNGADNMMENELTFLRRDSGAALTPNYMTAFSQDSSLATASEAKVPFGLSINSIQKLLEGFLNNFITKNLKECYPFLDDDLELKLGQANLYSRNEDFMNISQLYNMRACTFNELRKAAGLSPVEGGDIWGQEPPLDKTSINIKKEEKNKSKPLKEKYKKELSQIRPPQPLKENVMVIKKKDEKIETKKESANKSFKEALKEVLF